MVNWQNYENSMDRVSNQKIASVNGESLSISTAERVRLDRRFGGWSSRFWLWASIWLALLILALALLDVSTAAWVGRTIPVARTMWLFNIMKAPGNFVFTLGLAGALIIWHPSHWRAAVFVCGSGILSGLLCALMKWAVGRTRPLHNVPAFQFQPFRYGLMGLFHGENLSFPSGHTCLAFSTAAALAVLIPQWRIVFFAAAGVTLSGRCCCCGGSWCAFHPGRVVAMRVDETPAKPAERKAKGGIMRILILSDIHANPWALRAVETDAGSVDHILFAGDAVNYGPDPVRTVEWLDAHEVVGVRGNHDHAVAFDLDPKASPAKEPLALAMRDWTRDQLDPVQTGWLLKLPRHLDCHIGGAKFAMFHATPADPLYDYRLRPDISDSLLDELIDETKADVLVVGHTHLPVSRSRGSLKIVNPGSVGQPLDGDPRAAYAIWEDGSIELKRVEYDRSELFKAIRRLPLTSQQSNDLNYTLKHGKMASAVVESNVKGSNQ
jgi:putative phosphoesterase